MNLDDDLKEERLWQLAELTQEMQRRERQNAILWRVRNKSKWMKLGDAPSSYFFKLMQAKCARETLKASALPEGGVIEDEQEIVQEVYHFCRDLYARDPLVAGNNIVHIEILPLIDKFFTEDDNQKSRVVPQEEEINKIVFAFPYGKSLGEVGVTYEFVQDSWELVGPGCRMMVQSFWLDAKLTPNTINGIVKMMSKGFEMLENLDYWRNLTMLTTYKIISKILIERFKPMIPKLVDHQQTRFVKERLRINALQIICLPGSWAKNMLRLRNKTFYV